MVIDFICKSTVQVRPRATKETLKGPNCKLSISCNLLITLSAKNL